jgi:hypothetical protein
VVGVFYHEILHTLGLGEGQYETTGFGETAMVAMDERNNANNFMATGPVACDVIRIDSHYPNVEETEQVQDLPCCGPSYYARYLVTYTQTCNNGSCSGWIETDRVLIEIFCY